MDCHIPSVHASVVPIFQSFPVMEGMMKSKICTCKYLSLSGLRMSYDSAARGDIWHPIDVSKFFQYPLQTGPSQRERSPNKALEFWSIDI